MHSARLTISSAIVIVVIVDIVTVVVVIVGIITLVVFLIFVMILLVQSHPALPDPPILPTKEAVYWSHE